MLSLPQTQMFLDQSGWDVNLRIAHELWVRGVTEPVKDPRRIPEFLSRPPLPLDQLRQQDHEAREYCASVNCTRFASPRLVYCSRCYRERATQARKAVAFPKLLVPGRRVPPVERQHLWYGMERALLGGQS
jgi:hypothetical protein